MTSGDMSRALLPSARSLKFFAFVLTIAAAGLLTFGVLQPILTPEPQPLEGDWCGTGDVYEGSTNSTGEFRVLNDTVVANNSSGDVPIYVEAPANETIQLWDPEYQYIVDAADTTENKTVLYAPPENRTYYIFIEDQYFGDPDDRFNVTVEARS